MKNFLSATTSTCPVCRKLVQAKIYEESGRVFMDKTCLKHGHSKAMISSDSAYYKKALSFIKPANIPLKSGNPFKKACPDNCGYCTEHEQHLCMPIIEITGACNLNCPICITGGNTKRKNMSLREFKATLNKLIEYEGQINVLNLSGGEPLNHPQFKEIIKLCRRPEITRVSVSTNGLGLLKDTRLIKFLRDENVVISLQFDGFSDSVYNKIRGVKLRAKKLKLISLLGSFNAPMSIVCTLVKGVNENEMRKILKLFFSKDNILSLMIQPMAYAGKGADFPRYGTDRITIPDAIKLVAGNSGGIIKKSDFLPLPCSHPLCFSLTFLLKLPGGKYLPINRFVKLEDYLDVIKNKPIFGLDKDDFEKVKKVAYDLWSGPYACIPQGKKVLEIIRTLLKEADKNKANARKLFDIGERHIKSLFIHHFMDADTFDLSRARKCCNAYPQPDGSLMPCCVYNVLKRN